MYSNLQKLKEKIIRESCLTEEEVLSLGNTFGCPNLEEFIEQYSHRKKKEERLPTGDEILTYAKDSWVIDEIF